MNEPQEDALEAEPAGIASEGRISGTAAQAEPESDAPVDPEYVAALKAEIVEKRLRAKKVDDANAALVAAYVQVDGRLIDSDLLPLTDELLTDGVVDREKVSAAIADLLARKPILASRPPTAPLPGQGVVTVPEPRLGLFDIMRGI